MSGGQRAVLERLCARFGIATSYHDIWGKLHDVSDAGLRALLAEFEANADTPEQAARIEHSEREKRWQRVLEPVIAIAEGVAPWRTLIRLPEAAGALAARLIEEDGTAHAFEVDCARLAETGRQAIRAGTFVERELAVGTALPPGYHRLELGNGSQVLGSALVVAAPARCYCPDALADGARVWGPAVQLYALRSEQDWGIGDFSVLARLVEDWSGLGAGIVGLNPLHALFPHQPGHSSPYSPSSRERLNVLYIDVEAIQDFRDCAPAQQRVRSAEFQARLARLRESPLVDYPGVAAAKFEVLELLYAYFRASHLGEDTPRAREFRDYQSRGGLAKRRHALFEALQAERHATDPAAWG